MKNDKKIRITALELKMVVIDGMELWTISLRRFQGINQFASLNFWCEVIIRAASVWYSELSSTINAHCLEFCKSTGKKGWSSLVVI